MKVTSDKMDNLYATMTDKQYLALIEHLQSMSSFKSDFIMVPIMRTPEDYNTYVIKNFIRCGAIPKKDLIIGKTYIGSCRNAGEAVWLGEQFEYNRTKFGYTFKERINHFEDDNGYDLFVPLREK